MPAGWELREGTSLTEAQAETEDEAGPCAAEQSTPFASATVQDLFPAPPTYKASTGTQSTYSVVSACGKCSKPSRGPQSWS